MSPPIISIVGKSDSGKTTLIEKLVPELKSRGYRVGTIKHDAHSFDIDHPGKDSWRHKQAGAEVSTISSPEQVAVVRSVNTELTLDEITADYLGEMDVVLSEGYKREKKPKIEVLGPDSTDLISETDEVFMIATDGELKHTIPTTGRDDIKTIVDVIEERFIKGQVGVTGVELIVDGRVIPLNAIMQTMVANTVSGVTEALKGVKDPKDIQVRIVKGRR